MKLFCVKFINQDNKMVDVTHIVAKNTKDVHVRLDSMLDKCKAYNLNEYYGYRFYEVEDVEGYEILLNIKRKKKSI